MEGKNVSTHPDIPGEATHTGTSLLETATAAIQGFGPVNKIHQHLCAFHFYGHDMTRQVEAHHFCAVTDLPWGQWGHLPPLTPPPPHI